jgi:hypothetical protein
MSLDRYRKQVASLRRRPATTGAAVTRLVLAGMLLLLSGHAPAFAQGAPGAPPSAPPQGRTPWPAFALTTVDGGTVQSATLARPGRWLVVLLRRPCASCDPVMALVDKQAAGDRAARVAVIVSRAPRADIDRLKARFPNLAAASWFLDVNGQAAQALHAAEAPVVIGVEGDAIAWSWKGLALQPAAFEAALSGWLHE